MAALRLDQLRHVMQRCAQRALSAHAPDLIQVSPRISRFDEKVNIKVEGLSSGASITLHASTVQEWQRKKVCFVSCGHYTASQTGEVDLTQDTCLGGTYTGVDPMGLFWSMVPDPSGPRNMRMVVKNVERPVLYTLSVFLGHLTLHDLCTDSGSSLHPLSSATVERVVIGEGVQRIPVKEGTVRGMFFLPPGDGPFPGVIDMFGLAGGLIEIRAAMLAHYGFAVLALPFYRYADLPSRLEDHKFEYFENAVHWLSGHPSVRPGGVGIVAISGGANIAFMMSYTCPQRLDYNKCTKSEDGLIMKDGWQMDDKYIIPLWERDVHVLALTSDDDGQVRPEASDRLYAMYPPERRHLIQVVHYPGAGHLLEPPYTPHCRFCFNPYFDQDLHWGGRVKEHAAAQEDSWQRIRQFFHQHLPSAS